MTREQIIATAHCPKCRAKPGDLCTIPKKRRDKAPLRSHAERMFAAQDIAMGLEPTGRTGARVTDGS